MNVLNTVYFSHDEMKNILEHYGKVIRDNDYPLFKEKIPYESYRRLYGCSKGVVVIEHDDKTLWFYDATFEYNEPIYAEDGRGTKLIRFCEEKQPFILVIKPDFDFYNFFFTYYLRHHGDYHPQKEKKEDENMAIMNSNVTECTLTWNNNSATSNSSLAYGSTADREYDCLWTTTPNYINDWANVKGNWTITLDDVSIGDALKELAGAAQTTAGAVSNIGNEIKKLNDKNEKENKKMKGFNFDFGPCTTDNVRMSMYGIAVKNQASEWVSYNPSTGEIINVDIFNFEGGKYMFKMPVAPAQVAAGDVIIHNKKAMFVLDKDENGFIVVDPHAGEEKKVVPTSNCFGFNFITKVVSMFDAFAAAPTPDAPFGNFLPFMMMDSNGKDFDPMMMMLMMNQNGNMGDMFNNPMMMYFLMKDNGNDNMLPLMMMMGQGCGHNCKCGK